MEQRQDHQRLNQATGVMEASKKVLRRAQQSRRFLAGSRQIQGKQHFGVRQLGRKKMEQPVRRGIGVFC